MSITLARSLIRTTLVSFNRDKQQTRLNSNLKRAVIQEPSKPLLIEELKPKQLLDNQVRIEVSYCSINGADIKHFKDVTNKLPFVPGYELSGEVVEVGKNIKNEEMMKGEKVAGLNFDNFGGFASECILDIDDVWKLPSNVSLKEAAVLLCGHSTALLAFSKFAKISEDDNVIVTAGPAGLGLAAVDIAANVYKAKVIGVADNEERGELLREKGAFKTLHFGPKIQKDALKATNKNGANIVYDAVGEHMLESIGSCVAFGGQIFHAAPFDYKVIPVPGPNCSVFVLSLNALRQQDKELYKRIVAETLDLADQGIIGGEGIIAKIFEFEDVNKAIEYAQNANTTGKVLIEMGD